MIPVFQYMSNSIELTKTQHDNLFLMMVKDGFLIKKLPNDKFLISSNEIVNWMFKKVTKTGNEGIIGIEMWRHPCHSNNPPRKVMLMRL